MSQTTSTAFQTPGPVKFSRRELEERLERGELIHFPQCPFALPQGEDLDFLLTRTVQGAKSISYFPDDSHLVGHLAADSAEDQRLNGILREFNQVATHWLSKALPRYHASMRFGPLRFRTEEEEGRTGVEPIFSGSVLHVDMSSDAPAHGESFLRIFVNINPYQSRRWITSDTLGQLLDRWGDQVRKPSECRPGLWDQLKMRYGSAIGIKPPANSPYHDLMSRLHFFGKTDDYLQNHAPRTHWEFPPGAAWMVFSDIASHAVVSGRFAIDQTYLVPAHAFRCHKRSTKSTIERYWAGIPNSNR